MKALTARSRNDRRKRGTQYASILRDNRIGVAPGSAPSLAHSAPREADFNWRWVSGLMVIVLSGLLLLFSTADVFYVRSVAVGGQRYLTKEEVFAFAKVANMHIFWVDPRQVRANLLLSPSIAEARVWLSWPPQMVNIIIEEREPAIVWEQDGQALWVDIQGRMMQQRQDNPQLIRVSAANDAPQGILSEDGRVDENIVIGALQLQALLPEVSLLRYDTTKGLGIADSNGWNVWFGTGRYMQEKVAIYRAIARDIQARGIQASEVNIVNPDAPFYVTAWGR